MALAGAPLSLAGCAASSYAGIPLAAGAADPELQALAHRARAGDKHAQLELGIRYEEGRGVPVDLERAERLYRMAASDSGGTHLIHVPANGGSRTAVVPINAGKRVTGLPQARLRLAELLEKVR